MTAAPIASTALAILGTLAALSGCLFDCPYVVDSIEVHGHAAVHFGVANATLAAEALDDMGFAPERDGLVVRGEHEEVSVQMTLEGNGTWLFVQDLSARREFRSHDDAVSHVDRHLAAAVQRINATVAGLEARLGWSFDREPAQGSIYVC